MSKRAIVLLAKGFEEIEAVAVIDILRRANVNVQICSIDKNTVVGSHNISIKSDVRLDFIDLYNDRYDVVYIPGGVPGVNNLVESDKVLELIRKYHEDGVIIAAICAGPWVLKEAGIIKDHEVTSFPSFKGKVNAKNYVDEVFVKSGNILTSRGPGTAMEMGFRILQELGLEKEAKNLREDMQYNFLFEKLKEKE